MDIPAYAYTFSQVCTDCCIFLDTPMYAYIYIYICISTNIYIYIHIYIYIFIILTLIQKSSEATNISSKALELARILFGAAAKLTLSMSGVRSDSLGDVCFVRQHHWHWPC